MGKKLLVSLAMEGKFASDGLQAVDEGDDILMAMARELVTEKGIGESATLVWKQLQKQQTEVLGTRVVDAPAADVETPAVVNSDVIIAPQPVPAVVSQLLMFGDLLEIARRRKTSRKSPATETTPNQLALF
jgi:hypothetical protein